MPGARAATSAAFTEALRRGQPRRPRTLVGIEQEFALLAGDEPVDFRSLIHSLGIPGRRIDPGDPNAYRVRSGATITCDGREAEFAAPPLALAPGFTDRLDGWAAESRAAIARVVPDGVALDGYSTHLNVSNDDALNARVCRVYARTFAAGLMLLMDRASSPGLLVRPRPGRTELGGEHVEGDALRAASAYGTGSVLACTRILRDKRGDLLPPLLAVEVVPAVERFGWYVDRRAFGLDLYAEGRAAVLRRADGTLTTAQAHLERCWTVARRELEGRVHRRDLHAADALVGGDLPLPLEGGQGASLPRPIGRTPFGDSLRVRARDGFRATVIVSTWDVSVFVLTDGMARAIAPIPRALLPRFLAMLDGGDLDDLVTSYLAAPVEGRVVRDRTVGLYDELGPHRSLLSVERDPEPQAPPLAIAVSGSQGSVAVDDESRPGKRRIVEEPPVIADPDHPWWLWLLVALVILLFVIGGIAVLTGGGSDTTTATATPMTATTTATTTVPATTTTTTAAAPNRPPDVAPIVATFAFPVTTYTVSATDPDGDALTYTWSKTTERDCGDLAANGPTFTWSHPHPPCPQESFHPGTITVVVDDGHGNQVTATYRFGSEPGTGPPPG